MQRRFGVLLVLCLTALRSFAAITGTVMNTDGQPIANARVSIYSVDTLEERRTRQLTASPEQVPLAFVNTDAKGAYSLESPKESVVRLTVFARGYEGAVRSIERDEEVGAIALAKSEMRTGTVTAGGKPVAGATVIVENRRGYEHVVRTDEQGRYDAPDIRRAALVTVIHPDYAIDYEAFNLGGNVAASEMNRVLTPGITLEGRTVAADGTTPISGARIYVDAWPLGTSGEDGSFRIAHVPAKWTTLTARKASLIATRAFAAGAQTLRLAPGATIAGRITDVKTKMPVPLASVSLQPRRGGPSSAPRALDSIRTDAKGGFTLVAAPGSYTINVNHPAYALQQVEVAPPAGQQLAKDVTLTPLGRISGSVVDDEKRPVAGAVVTSERSDAMPGMMMRMFRGGGGEAGISGPDGRWSTRVETDAAFAMRATKKGLPSAKSDDLRLVPGERKTGVVLTLPSGIAVTGRVVDRGGKALSGVAVTAAEADPQSRGGGNIVRTFIGAMAPNEEETVTTGSDGTFTMRVKEGTYDFTFKREGFAAKTVRGQSVTPTAAPMVEATLDPSVEISGRVTRGGIGIEGARVLALGAGLDGNTMTAADGSFTLTGLAEGPLRLMVRKEEDFVQDTRNVTAPTRDLHIELPAGGRVTGRVVEKGTSKPVTTFQAGITTSRGGGGGMVFMAPPQLRDFTSDDGTFTLENVPTGGVSLVAAAPGYASSRINVTIEEGKTLSDVELQLDPGVRLVGRVTGANGSPLADATVRLLPSSTAGMSMGAMDRVTTTDANGEYSFETLEAGEETVSVAHPKHVATRRTVALKGRETRLDVQLGAGQRVTGTVVTEGGAPVADAEIDVSGGGVFQHARTNASGAFEIESMNPGRYRFSASKAGFADGSVDDFDVTSGPVRITLRTGGIITGRVTGLTPQELASAEVTARSGRSTATAAVDPNGNFRMEGAPVGTVQISAAVTGRALTAGFKTSSTQTVELAPGGSAQVDIEFRGDVVVRGRITRNGAPLSGGSISFFPRGGSGRASASASTDEQGRYSVSGLENGDYSVTVFETQRFSAYQTQYTVSGGGTFDVDYKTGTVRGRVLDVATNEAIANADVQLRANNNETMRIPRGALTDANGTFIIEGVGAGSYTVTATREGYGNSVTDVQVNDSGLDNLEIRISRNDGVKLNVVDARDGRGLSATVFVYDQSGRLVHESRFMFGGASGDEQQRLPVAPGSYTAYVSSNGYAGRNITFQSPSTQRVALTPGGTLLIESKHAERRRIRLIDASGLPYFRFSAMPPARDLLPNPGTTTLQNVAPGSYTLQLLGDNDVIVDSRAIVVQEGQVTRTDL